MKKALLSLLLCVFALSLASQPWDGPFGLKMGLTYEQLKAIDPDIMDIQENMYVITEVPTPHSSFKTFFLLVSPNTGLAKIVAKSYDITVNSYGTQLKSEFYDIREAISKKYGNYEDFDMLMPGSIWDEPNDFMMSLKLEERRLASWWELGEESNIDGVILQGLARNTTSGYIELTYEFKNFEELVEQITEKEERAF